MSPEPFRILRILYWVLAVFCGLALAASFASNALGLAAAPILKAYMPFAVCGLALSIVGVLINERVMRLAHAPERDVSNEHRE